MKGLLVSVVVMLALVLAMLYFLDSSRNETMSLEVAEENTDLSKSTNHRRTIVDDTLISKSELSTTPQEESLITDAKSPQQAELDGWYEGFRERLFLNITNAYESQPEEVTKLLKHLNHLASMQNSPNSPFFNPLIKPKYYEDFYTDDEWTTQVESELRAFILSQSLGESFKLIDIACKQLVCRLYYGGLGGNDLFKLSQAVSSYMESFYFLDYFGERDYESRTGSTSFGMANHRMFQYQQISFKSHYKR